jgi:hypothetical protein
VAPGLFGPPPFAVAKLTVTVWALAAERDAVKVAVVVVPAAPSVTETSFTLIVGKPGPPAKVLTWYERSVPAVEGFAAVWAWFVITATELRQPEELKPVKVVEPPEPTTAGSGLTRRAAPVSHTTLPRSWPPAELLASVTL